MTRSQPAGICSRDIIPYQELLGNYDARSTVASVNSSIIPYQELLGNYDACSFCLHQTRLLYHTKSY